MRQTENVVLGSKHKGYIEVNGRDVFAEGFVFALFVSFPGSVCVCECGSQLTCARHVLRDPCPYLPSPAKWRRMITYQEVNFISMEIPEGTLI